MHIGQPGRLLDHHAQLLQVHGWYDTLVLLNERTQDGGTQHTVIKVGSQGQHDDDRASWFAQCSHEQLQELFPLCLSTRLCEQFLELIDTQQHPGSLVMGHSHGELVQAACRVLF